MPRFRNAKTVFLAVGSVLLLVLFVLFGFYLDNQAKQKTVANSTVFMMDTFVDQKLVGAKSKEAVEAVNTSLKNFEKSVSAYLDESDIAKINESAGEGFVSVGRETYALLQKAWTYCERSGGRFDITIGPLADLWDITGENPRVPDAASILSCLELVDYHDLLFREEDSAVMLRRIGQKLNLGGMAKGAAGDLAVKTAKSFGIDSGYISVGGNIFAIGKKEDGSAYRFGIRDPRGEENSYIGVVELTDTTMATSGDYERFFQQDGIRYHHILDPFTGYPGTSDLISVSVICPDGALADFLSTTFFLAGKEKTLAYANEEAFDFILIDKDKNVYLSQGIRSSFTPNENAKGYAFVSE